MVRSIFALSLLGLGAVHALPAQQLQDRQIIGGGGFSGGSLVPGGNAGTFCDYNKPFEEQQGCTTLGGPGIISGGTFVPPKDKRDSEEAEQFMRHAKRQISIGKDCDLETVQALLSAIQDIRNPIVRDVVLQQLLDGYIYPNIKKCIGGGTGGSTGAIVPQPTTPGGSITPNPTIPGGSMVPSEPYVPGGSLVPENPSGGGSIYPSP